MSPFPPPRGLDELRARIQAARIPRGVRARSIVVATWNIRALGDGSRRPESLVYIAEILRSFSLVSIVELREDLTELRAILARLGPAWRALYSAPIFDRAGNRERIAFLFDTRFVDHAGLASGVQAQRTKLGEEYLSTIDWWRTPYLASFDAGGAELLMLTAHIRWGATSSGRAPELQLLADWVALELVKDPLARERQLLVTGDFNIPSLRSPLYEVLTSRGLAMPDALAGVHGSNLARDKRYDQILHVPAQGTRFTGKGGALDFYSGGIRDLYPSTVDKDEFTFELSDHLPLWAEIAIDARREN